MSSPHSRSITASLFDLRSIVENRQVQTIIKAYKKSKRDEESAKRILEPYRVHGTVVLTDSSGLTRLSQTHNLLEILALIQIPKELIYNLGKRLSGESIGVWAADNTAMFYHDTASSEDLAVLHLLLQERLEREKVQIGIAMHTGEFYRIGNNLYGGYYSLTDEAAENQAHGGEILVSASTKKLIEDQSDEDERFIFTERVFDESLGENVVFYTMKPGDSYHNRLSQRASSIDLDDTKGVYHIATPFPIRFYRAIISYLEDWNLEKLEQKTKRYFGEKTILLIQTHKDTGESGSDKKILESLLLDNILRNIIVRRFARKHGGDELKTGGGMSIVSFNNDDDAISASIDIREALTSQGIPCSAGVEKGEILLFRIGSSRQDCAGSPINIASKLGQDIANVGEILINSSIQVPENINQKPFIHETSGVTIRGVKI